MHTRKLPLPHRILTPDQETELARRVEAGVYADQLLRSGDERYDSDALQELVRRGQNARQELFESNLRLVMRLAHDVSKRYQLPVDDLFQEGCLALAHALRRFDYQRGVRLSTMAYDWILRSLKRAALTRCGSVDLVRRGNGARQPVQLLNLEHAPSHVVMHEDDMDRVERESLQFLDLLGDDAVVLRLRFGIGTRRLTRQQTAAALGLSATTVQRLEARALERARRLLSADRLRVGTASRPSPHQAGQELLAA
ncbi:MAG: sigma-70 family RNA polymerase sigma factor [Propionibacteriaceae bacterium]|nr:sigma-70 family RNA polymerase sigma factor [Propionibacteriaceae bacterium]